MKTIIIKEDKYLKLFNESRGVPSQYIEVAKRMARHIIDEHLYDLYEFNEDNEEEINSWDDSDDDYIEDSVEVDGKYYEYELYNMGNYYKKAETDGEMITINYEPINNILKRIDDKFSNLPNIDYSTKEKYIENTVYNYLYPVLLHEFTHNTSYDELETQGTWANAHRLNIDDVKEILYLFSENELNSRIASAYALMETALGELLMGGKFENGQEFYDFIKENIFNENELCLQGMEVYIPLMKHDFVGYSDKEYIKRSKNEKTQPYSLPYYLFKNDTRLKNNRKLNQLFDENYIAACKWVCDFYQNIIDEYKKKIIRTCYQAYQDYLEDKEIDRGSYET